MKTKTLLLSSLLLFILTGCYDETSTENHIQEDIKFFGMINESNTRATDYSWEIKDAIGIYMIKSGNKLNSLAQAENIKYITATSNGDFAPADTSKSIRFPYNGTNVDFIAYYPYKSSINSYKYPIDLTDQSKQNAIDLLYSNNIKNLNNSSSPLVALGFSHQLVKVIANISSLTSSYDLTGLKVIIRNVGVTANFSLADGSISEPTTIGTITFNNSSDGKLAQAILLPENDLSNKELLLINGDNSFTYKLSGLQNISSLEKGKKYTFNITINPKLGNAISVSNPTISNWTEVSAIGSQIDQDASSPKGSSANPYTITEAIKNQGDKNAWVMGYIVGYYSGTTFTSFVNNNVDVTKTTNIAIAASPTEIDAAKTFPVSLSTDALKEELNLSTNPKNLGKQIILNGDIQSYYGIVGFKSTTSYVFK